MKFFKKSLFVVHALIIKVNRTPFNFLSFVFAVFMWIGFFFSGFAILTLQSWSIHEDWKIFFKFFFGAVVGTLLALSRVDQGSRDLMKGRGMGWLVEERTEKKRIK